MVDTSVSLCGIELENPLIAASGTFGYGLEFSRLYDINILGSVCFKGTTLDPREGNPLPRIAECPEGLLNAVGLQNPGIKEVISGDLPRLSQVFHKQVMANISGFSIDEYVKVARLIDEEPMVGWIEVNISCPNVQGGGMSFGTDPHIASLLTKAVKKATKKPIIMKLTPNVTDIVSIARACEDAGADGLSLINTLKGMRINIDDRRPVLYNRTGGLSGPAIFPVALRMVYEVYEATRIPLIGVGGVSKAQDVLEMMLAGATAVEIGSANLVNPWVMKETIEGLPETMRQYHIKNLHDIIGGAH